MNNRIDSDRKENFSDVMVWLDAKTAAFLESMQMFFKLIRVQRERAREQARYNRKCAMTGHRQPDILNNLLLEEKQKLGLYQLMD